MLACRDNGTVAWMRKGGICRGRSPGPERERSGSMIQLVCITRETILKQNRMKLKRIEERGREGAIWMLCVATSERVCDADPWDTFEDRFDIELYMMRVYVEQFDNFELPKRVLTLHLV